MATPFQTAINNSGQVIGYAQIGNNYEPFLYSGGKSTDLSTLWGSPNLGGYAKAINASGEVVGYFKSGGEKRGHPYYSTASQSARSRLISSLEVFQ